MPIMKPFVGTLRNGAPNSREGLHETPNMQRKFM